MFQCEIPIPFKVSACEFDKLKTYHFKRLFSIFISLFNWKGKEIENNEICTDYLEFFNASQGYVVLTKINGVARATPAALTGYDFYGFPTHCEITNATLSKSEKRTFGVDAVLIRNNRFAKNAYSLLIEYADRLTQSDISYSVNCINATNTQIFIADDDPIAQQIRNLLDRKEQGEPHVLTNSDVLSKILGDNKQIPVIGQPQQFIGDKLIQARNEIYNQFFYDLGINRNGGNLLKSQYNNLEETNSNNSQILINRSFWLEPRKEACERFNKLFNSNLTVEITGDDELYALSDPTAIIDE